MLKFYDCISGVIFHIDDVAYFYYFYFKILWSLATLAVINLLESEFGKTRIFFFIKLKPVQLTKEN